MFRIPVKYILALFILVPLGLIGFLFLGANLPPGLFNVMGAICVMVFAWLFLASAVCAASLSGMIIWNFLFSYDGEFSFGSDDDDDEYE